jgi:hypothetical protein
VNAPFRTVAYGAGVATSSENQPALRPARPRRARAAADPQPASTPEELRELLEAAIDHLVTLEEKVDRLTAEVAALKTATRRRARSQT